MDFHRPDREGDLKIPHRSTVAGCVVGTAAKEPDERPKQIMIQKIPNRVIGAFGLERVSKILPDGGVVAVAGAVGRIPAHAPINDAARKSPGLERK